MASMSTKSILKATVQTQYLQTRQELRLELTLTMSKQSHSFNKYVKSYLDHSKEYFAWSDVENNVIYRADLDGRHQEILVNSDIYVVG